MVSLIFVGINLCGLAENEMFIDFILRHFYTF
jgi:hypothetical protein